MAKNVERFREAGVGILVITQARPPLLALFLRQSPLPFPVVGDPDRVAYRAFDLGRASFWSFLRPAVLWGYLRLILRGTRVRLPTGEEDVYQLGGDFLLDRSGRIRFAHRSRTATDRPTVETLLAAVRDTTPEHR